MRRIPFAFVAGGMLLCGISALIAQTAAPDADSNGVAPPTDIAGPPAPMAPILDADSLRFTFQARLTDNNGVPLPGPTVDLAFQLYTASGAAIGGAIAVADVPLANGIVDTLVPFNAADFDGTARAIGVRVDGGPELTPRLQLGAVPYAYRVNRVASAELDDVIELGGGGTAGALDVYGTGPTPTFVIDGGQAEAWAETSLIVGDIGSGTQHAALQSGLSFGGRLLTWDTLGELTAAFGSTAGPAGGGVMQLYRGSGGPYTVEIVGDDGNGSGRAVWRDGDAETAVAISAEDRRVYVYGTALAERVRLGGPASGNLQLRGGGPSNPLTVNLNSGGGGALDLYDAVGADLGVRLEGGSSTSGGRARVYNAGPTHTIDLDGSYQNTGAGAILVRDGTQNRVVVEADVPRVQLLSPDGVATLNLTGDGAGGGGGVSVRNDAGAVTIELDGDDENAGNHPAVRVNRADGSTVFALNANNREFIARGATIRAQNDSGQDTIQLAGDDNDSGTLRLRRANGTLGILARATEGAGSELNLYDDQGNATIQIDTDWNGNGASRIVANEVQITGGSDLSEQFEVSPRRGAPAPGMLVCIDADSPGGLVLCDSSYDRTVAGIISGAGGVQTGLYMGQKGTAADGQVPVALSGRVYCWVDADVVPVRPGDLLTTSSRAGHAMKATDREAAPGALIGKAMTTLEAGQGLVLVLVNLQ